MFNICIIIGKITYIIQLPIVFQTIGGSIIAKQNGRNISLNYGLKNEYNLGHFYGHFGTRQKYLVFCIKKHILYI